jgi:hypothetical protein
MVMSGEFVINEDLGGYDDGQVRGKNHNILKERYTMESSPNIMLPAIVPPAAQHVHANGQHTDAPGRPFIQVNNRYLEEIADAAQRAVHAAFADRLFIREARLVRLATNEHGRPFITPLSGPALRDRLAQAAKFVTVYDRGQTVEAVPAYPPQAIVPILLARDTWCLRPLRGIIEVPVLRFDGSVLATPGYDAPTALLYTPDPGLNVPPIPDNPTPRQVDAATDFLVNEVLIDFPFEQDGEGVSASHANALALLLTPIIRPLINDLAPLAVLDKPQQGTGASLFTEVVSVITTGSPASMSGAPDTEDEWRKGITAMLRAGQPMQIIDNVKRALDSTSLARVLTARIWEDRRLGRNEKVMIPHEATWMATGNNIELRGDLLRRAYWIRMNAKMARPWQRTGFKHYPLLPWVTEHRGEILSSLLTLARAWVAAGKPPAAVPTIGSFTAWAETIGGILAHAGIPGFLGNLNALYDAHDEATTQWAIFLRAWHRVYGAQLMVISTVIADMRSGDEAYRELRQCLPEDFLEDLYGKSEKGPYRLQRRLGNILKKLVERHFEDDLHIVKAGKEHQAIKWRVLKGNEAQSNSDQAADSPDSPHLSKVLKYSAVLGTRDERADSPASTDSPAAD